jgi:hypothetical protein
VGLEVSGVVSIPQARVSRLPQVRVSCPNSSLRDSVSSKLPSSLILPLSGHNVCGEAEQAQLSFPAPLASSESVNRAKMVTSLKVQLRILPFFLFPRTCVIESVLNNT